MALTKISGDVIKDGINVSGILTATEFVGDLTGNVNSSGVSTFSGGIQGNLTGNVTGNINSSGVSTLSNVVVGGATTALVVTGNARITGILTVGTSSLTLDGNTDTVRIGTGVTIQSGIVTAINYFTPGNRRVISLEAGIKTLFFEAAAPTGWTRITTHNNKALRVVSGAGGGSGGSIGFTTAFTSRTPTGSVSVSNASFTLTTTEIPSHGHSVFVNSFAGDRQVACGPLGGDGDKYSFSDSGNDASTTTALLRATGTGSGGSHTHNNTATFSGTAMDFAVQYIDMILCSVD